MRINFSLDQFIAETVWKNFKNLFISNPNKKLFLF